MNEDQLNREDLNVGFVNIYDEEDTKRWCDYFGITREQLSGAVMASGKSSVAIKKYLEKVKLAKLEQEKREERRLRGEE